MAKISSKVTKAAAAASEAAPAPGASSSHASSFSSPSYDASSSSGSTSPHSIVGPAASPPSVIRSPSLGGPSSSPSSGPSATGSPSLPVPPGGSRPSMGNDRMRSVVKHILDLPNHDLRENALAQLSKERGVFPDLAPFLWFSFGTIAILLQEVLSIYPSLSPPSLTPAQSHRACNALALLQCVASHPDTRLLFAQARIPFYLYSFLRRVGDSRPYEYLRLGTLGVIGALVKVPDSQLIIILLSSEIMPLCLSAMEYGSELSRTVAAFVVQRILMDDVGLRYVCYLPERVLAVCQVLRNVVASLGEQPSVRLLKHVMRCYIRLLDDERSLWAMRISFPKRLTDGTFDHCLREDETARMWLQQLLDNVQGPLVTQEGTVINILTWMLPVPMYS